MDFLQTKLPVGWKYVRLGQYVQKVTDYVASGSFASLNENVKYYKEPNYAILVKTQDFQTNFRFGLTYTDKKGYEFLENSNLFGGELILSNIGSIGKVFIVPKLDVPMSLAPNSIMIRFYSDNQIKWFYYLFSSTYGFELLDSISSGTTMRKFNKTDLKSLIVPIPPLQEQQRIAAKLDELFTLIDKIEKEQEELEEYKKLAKEKVLELAVTGKLIKQDPNDEPASELLERIKKEKEALIKAGKIKKDKAYSEPLSDDDKNYYGKLPINWCVVKVKDVCESFIGLTYKPADVSACGTPVLRSSNIQNSKIDLSNLVRVDCDIDNKLYVCENDILICARNGSKKLVGKSAVISNIKEPMTFGAFMALCRTPIYNWVFLFLQTNYFYNQLNEKSGTTTINQLTQKSFNNFILPLPPEAEQRKTCYFVKMLMSKL